MERRAPARAMLADLEALDWPAELDKETSAKLYEACAAEWKADMQSGFVRNAQEASEPVEAESLPASRSLQSVSATLTAEEARWRAGGAALEQHWLRVHHLRHCCFTHLLGRLWACPRLRGSSFPS